MSSLIRRFVGGLGALLRRRQAEQDLDDEVRAYLEASIEARMRIGVSRADAVRAARAEFGSIEAVKDYTRDAGWETRLENVWRDLRYAARTLRRSPAFAAAAVLTLALGIGANTAIFSAVNAIMLRELPVARPGELVSLTAVYPSGVEPVFSYAAYRRFADEAARLIDAIAASTVRREAVALDGPLEAVDHQWVSGNYFATLGVPAGAGRLLVPSDEGAPPGQPVAVLSDAYWTRRFGGDPSAIGRSFRFKARTFTIVGVAPRGFFGVSPGERVDVWMPLTAQPGAPSWIWSGHSTTWLRLLARRRPGVTLAEVQAGLGPVYERIRDDTASGAEGREFRASVLGSRLAVTAASRGASRLRDNVSGPLLVVMAIASLVLLVVCANVANLMLARAAARWRETAVCLAIGAERLRIVRQGIAEALLLALLGGAGGVLLAVLGASALAAMISGAFPISPDISPDLRVLGFAAAISCAAALAFGLVPALRSTRTDPLAALKSSSGATAGRRRTSLARTLVVAQLAISLVLLAAAGLSVRSLRNLRAIEMGFDPDSVLLFRMAPPADDQPLPASVKRQLYRELLAHVERVPGVEAASASFSGVFTRETWGNAIAIEGRVAADDVTPRTFVNAVTPAYFTVMRIAVLRGRGFAAEDHEEAAKVAVVNEKFVRQFMPAVDPIGKHVGFCSSDPCGPPKAMMTIVGVAEDAKYGDLREPRQPMLYVPFTQVEQSLGEVEVRTASDPAALAGALYRELSAYDRRLAPVGMMTASDRVDASLVAERLVSRLSATFGLLALALAAVGLYGLVAYMAAQRTGEIGIRMALGADRRDIRRLVLRDTMHLLAGGLLIGVPLAIAGARLAGGWLYGVSPTDPLAMTTSLITLAVAVLVAGYLPARRASRLDPSIALRVD